MYGMICGIVRRALFSQTSTAVRMLAVLFAPMEQAREIPQMKADESCFRKIFENSNCSKISEKGKPSERVGRKAMGPKARMGYGSPVASILINSS